MWLEAFFVHENERFATGIDKAGYAGFFESQYTPYFGGKFTVSNIPYYSEEEELLLWSETSLRGPLITAGYERYMELFKKILPQKAEQINFL